ncbi:MAG TPA: hypothetical protein VGQ57_20685 [Polyangiaceae bacterium]|nr:hypothetical protein [Polyangiaceae bacterium]
MSVEIATLLLRAGASESEVEDALSRAVGAGQSLACALGEGPDVLRDRLDRELTRIEAPSIEMVRPDVDQLGRLPAGLAAKLGAVPVRRDARSGRVDVAVLDPLDRHVTTELEFHLGAKVRLLRAAPEVLRSVIDGTAAPAAPRMPSGPPLPLVRKAVTVAPAIPASQPPPPSEPVLSLSRPKSSAQGAAPQEPLLPLDQAEATFERTRTPDDVVAALLLGIAPAQAVVLAVRSKSYVGRAGSQDLSQVAVRKVDIPTSSPSAVQTATRAGFYLGALPHTPAHAGLRELFGESDAEMYAAAVTVSAHPSLVVLCEPSALGGSLEATRRVDALVQLAARALERILLSRKRGG